MESGGYGDSLTACASKHERGVTIEMKKTQRGMTFWGVMVIMIMAGTLGLIAMHLAPIYMDDMKITSALDALKSDTEGGRTRTDILAQFFKVLSVNDVTNIRQDDLKVIPKDSGGFSIALDYEVRVPILYNVDAVVKFSHHEDVR